METITPNHTPMPIGERRKSTRTCPLERCHGFSGLQRFSAYNPNRICGKKNNNTIGTRKTKSSCEPSTSQSQPETAQTDIKMSQRCQATREHTFFIISTIIHTSTTTTNTTGSIMVSKNIIECGVTGPLLIQCRLYLIITDG